MDELYLALAFLGTAWALGKIEDIVMPHYRAWKKKRAQRKIYKYGEDQEPEEFYKISEFRKDFKKEDYN